MDHQNDHDHDQQQQFTGLLRPLSASLLAPDAFSFNWCPQSQDWISATKITADNKENRIQNGYAIFQEDVISVIRSCIDPSRFLITHFPLLNDKRTRQCVHLALSDNNSTIDHADQFESALRTWLRNPQELPHRPLPEHSRRLLVLLNPFSGQRKALQLWRQEVEPVWREAGFQIELAVTERAGHATEMMATVDLDRVGMLALGGGDGLVSEALHGLLSRPSDQERALRLPILHLPMGTGNALASSLAFQANEPFASRGCFCLQMALMAVRPVFRRLRLYNVEFSGGQRRTMFLSLSWGLMADIDIGSERFRFLGQARLHLEAFLRVAFLPSMARYRARISYLPVPEGPELTELMTKLRAKKRSLLGQEHFKGGEFGDGEEEEEQQQAEEQEVEMPSLSECVPSSWKILQGEFCFVHLAALSHLGSDLPYLPSARLHDRCMFLTFVQWPRLHSRVHMARILLSIDTSDHLDDSVMEIIPVLACRVEPEAGAGGWLALDGEAVDQSMLGKAGAFQASVSNQCATVIGRRLARRSTASNENGGG